MWNILRRVKKLILLSAFIILAHMFGPIEGNVNQTALVNSLKRIRMIYSARVEETMLAVDRGNYCKLNSYKDSPQSIGYKATISAPHMHALSLELLKDHLIRGENALDVGSGSGYLTACMALMVGSTGKVLGIDYIPELVQDSIENIKKDQPDLISSGRVTLVTGDGRFGYRNLAPYNAIHVGAAAAEVPEELINQLKIGGRMVIPVGSDAGYQEYERIDKLENGQIQKKKITGVKFVPLVKAENATRYSSLP